MTLAGGVGPYIPGRSKRLMQFEFQKKKKKFVTRIAVKSDCQLVYLSYKGASRDATVSLRHTLERLAEEIDGMENKK